MRKAEARALFSRMRNNLSAEDVQQRSAHICAQVLASIDLGQLKAVHIFLPMRHKLEVDTWAIIDVIRQHKAGIDIAVPVCDIDQEELCSHLLEEHTILKENKWGIPEPLHAPAYEDTLIDLVFLPLLAFDLLGGRVGYGKGFYDKFLSRCRKDVIKAGLSFFEPVDKIEDLQAHDVPLDLAFTPHNTYRFH